jgi:hypothetical protein
MDLLIGLRFVQFGGWKSSNSTSNVRVAFLGITGGYP